MCGVGTGPNDLEKTQFPTTTPAETVQRACDFFSQRRVDRLGIASFGPVDLCPASPTFGHITSTPKTGWQNFDIAGELRRAVGIDVAFDTDVNGACWARFDGERQEA